ncbi:MAG: protein kinase [Candidatus Obscuribacterales bacterium]
MTEQDLKRESNREQEKEPSDSADLADVESYDADNAVATQFNIGSIVLEKYQVIKLLGVGGMGSVYQVRNLHSHVEYALKYLNSQHTTNTVWRRFDNEARAAGKLDHPNLVKVHDFGLLPDGQPYFVMDLVRGVTLR